MSVGFSVCEDRPVCVCMSHIICVTLCVSQSHVDMMT